MCLIKKIIVGVGALVGVAILAVGVTAVSLWFHEFSSLASTKTLMDANEENHAGPVYEISISGGYYFDSFIEQGGAKNDQELINFLVDNLTKGIIPISLNAPTIGCSSFTFVDEDGDRYFGRNYDFSETTALAVKTNPGGDRHASVSFVDLQFLGITGELDSVMKNLLTLVSPYVPLDGINDAGVSCGIYMSYQSNTVEGIEMTQSTDKDTDKPDLTSTTMLRAILDYADSVGEAIEIASSYDLHDSAATSFHYMVADATGKSAILEWVAPNATDGNDNGKEREFRYYLNDDDAAVGEKEGKDNFQYITNFIVTPNYYSDPDDMGGLDRYEYIQSFINPDGSNTDGVMSYEKGLELLHDVGRRYWDPLHGRTDSNSITCWSSLYNLTDRTVTWVPNEGFDNENSIFTYSL